MSMNTIKFIGVLSTMVALLCMTGFDCPECNYAAQFTALGISTGIALLCGCIIVKKQKK